MGADSGPKSDCSKFPTIGIVWSGYAMDQRIIIIRANPKSMKSRDITPYWMPMTLWSVEKIYFCQKFNS